MSELSTISYADVRDSIAVAKSHGEKFFEQIVWQVENETWTILGYESWDEMREAEYADMGVVAPRADRPELVSRLRARGLTQQEVADTLGVNRKTVMSDISKSKTDIETITNSRGQQRPATYTRRPSESELMAGAEWTPEDDEPLPPFDPRTGEILDDGPGPFNAEKVVADSIETARKITGMDGKTYTQPQPKETKPRRPALNDQFFNAVFDMTKQIERVARLTEDDRFNQNKEKVAQKHLNDLLRSRDLLQQVIEQLN